MTMMARETVRRAQAPRRRSGAGWSAAAVARCTPQLLRVIVALLLEPRDLRTLAAPSGDALPPLRPARVLDDLVARAAFDEAFAGRLAACCARRTASVAHLLACSPYEALALWGRHGTALSRREIGALLARLACSGDAVLEPLARRLCGELQLAALRALPGGTRTTSAELAGP